MTTHTVKAMSHDLRDLTFRQLEALIAIVHGGSFGAAAGALDLSQVSVSRHVQALERSTGLTLFERVRGKPAALTQAGDELFDFAEMVMAGMDRIRQRQAGAVAERIRVEIAASEAAIDLSFLPALAQFYVRHPDIEIHFHPIKSALSAVLGLDIGKVDLAYVALTESPEYVSGRCLGEIECDLYATPLLAQHLEAGLRPVPVIWPPQDGPVSKLIAGALTKADLAPYERVQRVQRLANGLDLALLGLGVCCLSRVQVRASVERGRIISIGALPPLYSYVIPVRLVQSKAAATAEGYFSNIIRRDTIDETVTE